MSSSVLKSTHSGKLTVGKIDLECHVLEDGSRIFSARDLLTAFGLDPERTPQKSQPQKLAEFLAKIRFISIGNEELTNPIETPIKFTRPGRGGHPANGYQAELIPAMCNAVLKLSEKTMLPIDLRPAVERSRELLNAFANVGIIALVDEATGFQEYRDKHALRDILDKYLKKEHSRWAKRFPDEFYKEMFRLKGWEWKGMRVNRPQAVGGYTRAIVYGRLAPGLLEELENLNPSNDMGERKVRHHQWLTDDVGHPALGQHIHAVVTLMKVSKTWSQFKEHLQKAFPVAGDQGLLDLELDEE